MGQDAILRPTHTLPRGHKVKPEVRLSFPHGIGKVVCDLGLTMDEESAGPVAADVLEGAVDLGDPGEGGAG